MISSGVFKVGMGGGEPLIRRDCLEIVAKLSSANIDTNITTNGWSLTPKVAAALKEAGLRTLYVSLDSADENIHDSFRRKSGSYQRVIAALRAAVTAGLSVRLSTVVTQVNVDDLRNIVRIAEDVGIYGVEFKRFRPAGNGVARKTDYSLQPEQETCLRETIEELKKISPLAIQLVYGAEPGGPDLGCPCGTRSITLRPNGDIAPCAYSEHIIGNAMATPLSQIWRDSQLLNSMRTAGGCVALTINRNPSNPVLSAEGHYAGSEKIAT